MRTTSPIATSPRPPPSRACARRRSYLSDYWRRRQCCDWRGALTVFPQLPQVTDDPIETTTIKVLKAGPQVLEDDSKTAASLLFIEVNEEILQLGHRFGITSPGERGDRPGSPAEGRQGRRRPRLVRKAERGRAPEAANRR